MNTCSIDITIPALAFKELRPPFTYFVVAYKMLAGTKVLVASTPIQEQPLALLCVRTLECSLKAFITRNGDDSKVKKIGDYHDLVLFWSEAEKDGLCISKYHPDWVTILSEIHKAPYALRYLGG